MTASTILTQDQLSDLGQRLLACTPGGSEYFNRRGDGYVVDVDACMKFIEHNKHKVLAWAKECKRLEAQIAELKKNQRTPGTTEVCERHVYQGCRNHGGTMKFEKCKLSRCPMEVWR